MKIKTEIVEFIFNYFTCSRPDGRKYPEISHLIRKVQTHHHTTTFRRRNDARCIFNAPWPPSLKTRVVWSEENLNKAKVRESKRLAEKVLSYIVTMNSRSDATQTNFGRA